MGLPERMCHHGASMDHRCFECEQEEQKSNFIHYCLSQQGQPHPEMGEDLNTHNNKGKVKTRQNRNP